MCVANLITSRDCHVIALDRKKWILGNGGSLIDIFCIFEI